MPEALEELVASLFSALASPCSALKGGVVLRQGRCLDIQLDAGQAVDDKAVASFEVDPQLLHLVVSKIHEILSALYLRPSEAI